MAECTTPFMAKGKDGSTHSVPCGKCPNCLKRRTSGWSFRLIKHGEVNPSSYFVTYTYDTDHVPISKTGFMTLDKRHLQLFHKRVRNYLKRQLGLDPLIYKISYYSCGEYGSKSWRPHYHEVLFFNFEFPQDKLDVMLKACWLNGDTFVGTVTGASIGYVLKYMNKGKRVPAHKNDDRLPEFANMSKGMGKNYLTPEMIDWHNADIMRVYIITEDGQKLSMPRYYKDKLYTEFDRQEIGRRFSAIAEANAEQLQFDWFVSHGTMDGFTKYMHESRVAQIENFRMRSMSNRNKI